MPKTLVALLLLVFSTPATLAQSRDDVNGRIDMLLGAHQQYETLFDTLQAAVEVGDPEAVASLVSYPITVKVGDAELTFDGPEAFASRYADIFTDEIKSAVLGQKYDELFVRDQGVMFGNGQVWLSGICLDEACETSEAKIITIQSTR